VPSEFVWTAVGVARAWGFASETLLNWVRGRLVEDFPPEENPQYVLVGFRGDPFCTDGGWNPIMQGLPADPSVLPAAFYEWVEELCPGVRKVELFARGPRDGWEALGDGQGGFSVQGVAAGVAAPDEAGVADDVDDIPLGEGRTKAV